VRDFDRQVAELQNRIAVLNGYTALGIPVTNSCGMSLSGESENSDIIGFVQLNRNGGTPCTTLPKLA
jgi:hypothetical protein